MPIAIDILAMIEFCTFLFCPHIVTLFAGYSVSITNNETAIYNSTDIVRPVFELNDLTQLHFLPFLL